MSQARIGTRDLRVRRTLTYVDTFWAGLIGAMIGAVVGGLFTLLGAWLQGRATHRASVTQIEAISAQARQQRESEVRHVAHLELLRVVASGWHELGSDSAAEYGKRVEAAHRTYQAFLALDACMAVEQLVSALLYEVGDESTPFETHQAAIDLLQRELADKHPNTQT